jgi:Mannosyltransferase (PIG-V)
MIENRRVPAWVRTLDALCLAGAAVAAIVALSGGFRTRIGGVRLGVTSPLPLLLWCVAIAAIRHLAAPQPPLYRELWQWLRRCSRLTAVRCATAVTVGTRPVILLVGYLAIFMIGYANGDVPLRHFRNEILNLPVRWDAGWYLQIVTDGYRYVPSDPTVEQNIAFFPAYPVAVRVLGRLLGGDMIGYVAAGMTVSLLSFFGALVYLYTFTRDRFDEDTARYTLWFLAVYPFALFFGAVYTESLFLLGTIATFYHVSKQQFGRAAAWGILVGLTRINGSLMALPLGVLALESARAGRVNAKAFAVAVAPGVGLLAYALFLWNLTGEPLAFAKTHAAWGRTYQGLGTLAAHQYSLLANAGLSGYVGAAGFDVLNLLGALFAAATLWPVCRHVGLAYGVFMLVNMLPPLASGGFLSIGRFSSVLFPAFIWLASAVPATHRAGWIAGFMALQAFTAALFYTWRPIF